jgi:hypothetical protein
MSGFHGIPGAPDLANSSPWVKVSATARKRRPRATRIAAGRAPRPRVQAASISLA